MPDLKDGEVYSMQGSGKNPYHQGTTMKTLTALSILLLLATGCKQRRESEATTTELPKATHRTSEAKKPQPKQQPEEKKPVVKVKEQPKPEQQQPAKPVKERELLPEEIIATTEVIVEAYEFQEAYQDNPVAADAKFKGKRLCTTSEVKSIGTVIGRLRVTLYAGIGGEIECYFSKDRLDDVIPLRPGCWVCVVGTCRGKIGLDNCRIALWAEDGKQLGEKLRELAIRTKKK